MTDHDTTTFDLSDHDVKPFDVDYQIFSYDEESQEIPEDCYFCVTSNYYIKPLPVEVADDIMNHIGAEILSGQFKEIFEMVADRWQELGIQQENRDLFGEDER